MNPRPMTSMAVALLMLWACVCTAAPLATPAPPQASLQQRLGAELPLDLALRDELGHDVRLGDFFRDGRPAVLVLGYYRCPQLCGLVMHGLLQAVHFAGIPADSLRIVSVSIDPQDTPATASARKRIDLAYARFLSSGNPGRPPDLHLLTGAQKQTAALARTVGFRYEAVKADAVTGNDVAAPARFSHAAGILVVTPRGRVSRYLMGVRFDPGELQHALSQARGEAIGSLTDRIALLCACFDPQVGRLSAVVMDVARVVGLCTVAALGLWAWRRRVPRRKEAR